MPLPFRHLARVGVACLFVLLAAGLTTESARGEPPPLTAQQKERLKERDKFAEETRRLRTEDKLAEAIDAAEKMLAIEREIFGNVHEEVAGSLRWLAEVHGQREDFAAARKAGAELLAVLVKLHGKDNWRSIDARHELEYLDFLSKLSSAARKELAEADRLMEKVPALRERGNYSEAVSLTKRVVERRSAVLGQQHPRLADSLNLLAELYYYGGRYSQALPLYSQAVEIRKKALGEWHPDYASSLNNFAALYFEIGEIAKAEPLYRQALEIQKRALGEKNLQCASSLMDLARVYRSMAAYRKAELAIVEALDIFKQLEGEKSLGYGESLNVLASIYVLRGEYRKAEPVLYQALHIKEQTLGKKHPGYGKCLGDLAEVYMELADYPKAVALLCQGLEIKKQSLGEKHIACGIDMNNLAMLYQSLGDYSKAASLMREATTIFKQHLGEKHPRYAKHLHNLASLCDSMGNYSEAERLYLQALKITKQVLGEKHPDYAIRLVEVAALYASMKNYAKAEPLFCQALEIRKQALGEKHPDYGQSLFSLALLHQAMGADTKAEPLFQQALEITKQVLGQKHPAYAAKLQGLARLYEDNGAYAKAEPLYRQALEIEKQTLGERHPDYADSMHNFALFRVVTNDANSGLPLSRQAAEIVRKLLDRTAAVQSQSQQLNAAHKYRPYLDGFLSVSTETQSPSEKVYDEILLWKGAVTARQRAIRRFRANLERAGKKEVLATYDELIDATRQLANLVSRTPPPAQLEAHRARIQKLDTAIERLEQKLANESAEFRNNLDRRRRTSTDLRRALPANAVFIDLVEYNRYLPPAKRKDKKKEWQRQIVAFVVRPNQAVVRVELGPAEPIDVAVANWRSSFGNGTTGADIRRLVWEPLVKHVGDAAIVLISPDGPLTRFPFAALPGKRPNTYLIEDLAVAVVAVPQQLPELFAPTGKAGDPSLLVVGKVNYGGDPGRAKAGVSRDAARDGEANALCSWRELPGTGPEARAVRDQFQRLYPQGTVSELFGDTATETAIRRLAGQRRYLHFATHGYYDPPGLRSMLAGASRNEGLMIGRQTVTGWNPGLLCGFVLAGANRPREADKDDGILTAMELEAFDLNDVELAVLSACQTAQGERTVGGEGLLGLQRAFQTAGARTVVASLWSVDDAATQTLMTRFYENLWQKKLPKLEALRQAQLSLLYGQGDGSASRGLEIIHEGLPAGRTTRAHPRLWAAWSLSGDPGDLSRIAPVVERVSAYPPLAEAESAPEPVTARSSVYPWLLTVLAVVLAVGWSAWRRFRGRGCHV